MRLATRQAILEANRQLRRMVASLPSKQLVLVAVVELTAAVGVRVLTASHAAAPAISAEVEQGAITAPAARASDSSASGGKSVQFGGADASSGSEPFITRSGTQLLRGGQPYRFVGFNFYGFDGCEGYKYTDADIDAYFASLPAGSMTRTWAFQPYGFSRLDYALKSAAEHHQYMILVLAASGDNCDQDYPKSTAWYSTGYQANYIPWVKSIVAHYKDNPAVGMWEIMNEPGHGQGQNVTDADMKAFYDTAAATIKSIDKNHLVESGTLGEYVPGTTDYASLHSSPNIDVGSLHEYDYDDSDGEIISSHLAPTQKAMSSLNKPIIVGEMGLVADQTGCKTNLTTRANVFKQKFDGYFARGVAGVMIWDWSMRDTGCTYEVRPDDPTMNMIRSYVIPY